MQRTLFALLGSLLLIGFLPISAFSQDAKIRNSVDEIDPAYAFDGITFTKDGRRIPGKVIEFLLANSGGGTLIFDRLYIQVLHAVPYTLHTFPTGPLARMIPNKYNVTLSSGTPNVEITSDRYELKKGESSLIQINLDSPEKLQYEFEIVAEGFDLSKPNERIQVKTPTNRVTFPEVVDYKDLIGKTKHTVDLCLNGPQTSEVLMGKLYDFMRSTKVKVRILTSRAFFYGQGSFRPNTLVVESAHGSLFLKSPQAIIGAGFDKFRTTSRYDTRLKNFIVIDHEVVLANETRYILGKTSVYTDQASIQRFESLFESLWAQPEGLIFEDYARWFTEKSDISGSSIFQFESKPPSIDKVPRERLSPDHYAYLLRFVSDPKAEQVLADLKATSDAVTKEEAEASLKIRKIPKLLDDSEQ
jgi:hypothetical protein